MANAMARLRRNHEIMRWKIGLREPEREIAVATRPALRD